ncbi:hypothetical protein KAR91_44240 [Candidatus Pacearchaeota archaeon]|nr:hypothetical protein [Candidatus Pacearchaeota archaeon]
MSDERTERQIFLDIEHRLTIIEMQLESTILHVSTKQVVSIIVAVLGACGIGIGTGAI